MAHCDLSADKIAVLVNQVALVGPNFKDESRSDVANKDGGK